MKMKVVLVTPEAVPYTGAGERADFGASLPERLSSAGLDVSVVMPKYRTPEIEALETRAVFAEILVPFGGDRLRAAVVKAERGRIDRYFIDHPKYFGRENIYGPPTGDYLDNDERFIFFCRAALEFLQRAGWTADIIHALDWPTALVPVFLKSHYAGADSFRKARSVFTFSGADPRGEFPVESLTWTGLGWEFFSARKLSLNGKIDLLKAGLVFADIVTTVPGFPLNSARPERDGAGLGDVLRSRKGSFFRLSGDAGWSEFPALYERALNSRRGG